MGRTVTPKYSVEIFETRLVNGRFQTVKAIDCMTWDSKRHGTANAKNLEKLVLAYGKSLEAGGSNEGISKDRGYIPYPNRAEIRLNKKNGATVAAWQAPAFMVW